MRGNRCANCAWIGPASVMLLASVWLCHRYVVSSPAMNHNSVHETVHNCGVESVVFLASCYRIADPTEVRQRAAAGNCVKPDGSINMADLVVLCETVGLGEWRGLHADVEDLASVPTPFIAHLQYDVGHFVVCNKISEEYVQVIDMVSDHGPVAVMPIDAFKTRFTGAIAVPVQPLEHYHE